MRTPRVLALLFLVLLVAERVSFRAVAFDQPRAIELGDIMAWKAISTAIVSDNGEWFAYRIGPAEGDSSVVIRQTRGDKEYSFPSGEGGGGERRGGPPRIDPGAAASPATLAFSSDARYAAFTIYPARREAQQLRRQRKPVQNKAAVVNLATGEKVEVPNVRSFAFSGENAGWIALHKYGPASEAPGGGAASAAGPARPGGPGASAAARDDRPKGSDLILRELATGQELNLGNVSEFGFDKKGRYLAWLVDAADGTGNGVQIRDMQSGAVRSIDSDDKAVYARLSWTEDGEGLAVLRGSDDKDYEDRLNSVVGFKGFGAGGPQKTVFNPVETADDRMERLLCLFELRFADPTVTHATIGERPVYLAMAMDAERRLRLKPQNLLLNLPLARRQ